MTEQMSLREALAFDPLDSAEKLTGKSYEDDDSTLALGFLMQLGHNERKQRMLTAARDSHHSMGFIDSLALFADLGFGEVYREEFPGHDGAEIYVILWHSDGLLATCESYGEHRNSAKVYYNFRHTGSRDLWSLTSSGHGREDGVWVGDHDAREGIRHNLDAYRAEGEFLDVWVERPFLWLLNYSEAKVDDYDYAAINAAKIQALPLHVQRAITPSARV